MPVHFVVGDPLLTQAQTLAIAHNAKGRTETGILDMAVLRRYPAALSVYQRRCRQQKHAAGTVWLWQDNRPRLLILTVRETATGITRLRYVQAVLMTLARDYALYGITSLAIAPIGNHYEKSEILKLYPIWLGKTKLPVFVYTEYAPNIAAEDPFKNNA
jgi:hypothetical protein